MSPALRHSTRGPQGGAHNALLRPSSRSVTRILRAEGKTAMTFAEEVGEVCRCEICGNVVEVVYVGDGQPICRGGPMTRVEWDTAPRTNAR